MNQTAGAMRDMDVKLPLPTPSLTHRIGVLGVEVKLHVRIFSDPDEAEQGVAALLQHNYQQVDDSVPNLVTGTFTVFYGGRGISWCEHSRSANDNFLNGKGNGAA